MMSNTPKDLPTVAADLVAEATVGADPYSSEAIAAGLRARKAKLEADIKDHTSIKTEAQRRISEARVELRRVVALLNATKPRTRKTAKKAANG